MAKDERNNKLEIDIKIEFTYKLQQSNTSWLYHQKYKYLVLDYNITSEELKFSYLPRLSGYFSRSLRIRYSNRAPCPLNLLSFFGETKLEFFFFLHVDADFILYVTRERRLCCDSWIILFWVTNCLILLVVL